MKKLLINGCSFVAGDAIVWDEFAKSIDNPEMKWDRLLAKKLSDEEQDLFNDYRFSYRRKKNLPSLLAKKLDTEWIDISEDGNSNDAIALTTILALLKIPERERMNYHVVVGWTSLTRVLKYSENTKSFLSLNHYHLKSNHEGIINELRDYLTTIVQYHYDHDLYYNYIRNILMLENFLKANNCTYTFYRSMGTSSDCENYDVCQQINSQLPLLNESIEKNMYTDDRKWFKFSNDCFGLDGESLASEYSEKYSQYRVSSTNWHPNILAIEEFSNRLVDFIKNQGVGF